MKNIGSVGMWLVILGIGSFALNYFGYEFRLLSWVDAWGAVTGVAIRIVCIAIGAALMFVGRSKADQAE